MKGNRVQMLILAAVAATPMVGWPQIAGQGPIAVAADLKAAASDIAHGPIDSGSGLQSTRNGPADPTNPAKPLFCNADVQREFGRAFMKTKNGEARMGLAEAGRSIELRHGTIVFGPWSETEISDGVHENAHRMLIAETDETIAVFHTHGNRARAVPSQADLHGTVPDFVISQTAVYVTLPGSGRYLELKSGMCR